MIASSRSVKLAALAGAVALHAALAAALIREEPILVEGGGAQEARLGNSFADMAAGTLSADPASEVIEAEAPDQVTTADPEPLTGAEPPDTVEAAPPEEIAPAPASDPTEAAETARPAETLTAEPEPTDMPALTAPEVADGVLPVRPEPLTPSAAKPETPTAVTEALRPDPADPVTAEPVAPEEVIAVLDPDSTVPKLSKRPVRRDPALETPVRRAAAPAPKPRPQAQPRQAPQGNSGQDARAGTARGTAEQADTRQGSGASRSDQAGNAAVSNYPGLVNRHLSRVRKPSMNRRGVVRVAFSIASSGGLAGVSVASSSGSTQLDKAALTMISRAAPFPRPPAGARRDFSINIEFR